MQDRHCVTFLQWALPKLNLRWQGFRRVRRQVCRRIDKRIAVLQLADIAQYREYLITHPDEWATLDYLCRITISRFYRDRVIFDFLAADVLPALIEQCTRNNRTTFRMWSCGCASGEEPYTLALLWHYVFEPHYPDLKPEIIATDIDPVLLERASQACYNPSSLRYLPAQWVKDAFKEQDGLYCLKDTLQKNVHFALQDVREQSPDGLFQVVFCRNLAFTYFDRAIQKKVLERISRTMAVDGVLITGKHEFSATERTDLRPWIEHMPIFQKIC